MTPHQTAFRSRVSECSEVRPSSLLSRVVSSSVLAVGALASSAGAGTISVSLPAPSMDRWNYPFASSPGGSSYAAIFAPLTNAGFDPQFDNRDGQMVVGFNTLAAGVPVGLGRQRYVVQSVSVYATIETGDAFAYDPSPDSFRTWLGAGDPDFVADADAGHAVELFGTGFRNAYTSANYTENVPYSPLGPFGKGVRSAYPLTMQGGRCRDASNNVDARFDATPFAVGRSTSLIAGQLVPIDTELRFEIDVNDADVQRWLGRALNEGRLTFSIASIFPSQQQHLGGYPRFYARENLAVLLNLVSAARLELTVNVLDEAQSPRAGDVDGNGMVNVADLLGVITSWGDCPCCAADIDGNDRVDVADLLTVITTWGS